MRRWECLRARPAALLECDLRRVGVRARQRAACRPLRQCVVAVRWHVDAPTTHRQQPRALDGTTRRATRGDTPNVRRRANPLRGAADRSRRLRRSETDPRRPDSRRVCEPDVRASHVIKVGSRPAMSEAGLLDPVHRKPIPDTIYAAAAKNVPATCLSGARHGPVGAVEVAASQTLRR